ncbi:UNVERIFIED_CONTAM: hypothetical protein FKN15_053577 [Acipenser sinensis]
MVQHRVHPCTALLIAYRSHSSLKLVSSEVRRNQDGPEQEVLQGPYLCPNCSLTFQFLENYVSHMREHKLFLCLRCGKTFTQKGNLTRHIRMHTGFKPYQCSVCTKTFTQKVSLQDHMNLHSGTRPHCCNYCKLHFAQKPALRRHLREMHRKSSADNFNEEIEELLGPTPLGCAASSHSVSDLFSILSSVAGSFAPEMCRHRRPQSVTIFSIPFRLLSPLPLGCAALSPSVSDHILSY